MSFDAQRWRLFARGGGGGQVDFRGPITTQRSGLIGSVFPRLQGAWANQSLVGVTYKSDGSVSASVAVALVLTSNNVVVAQTVSDASGNFRFDNPGTGPYYCTMYLAGAPDFAGTTVNTLMPA